MKNLKFLWIFMLAFALGFTACNNDDDDKDNKKDKVDNPADTVALTNLKAYFKFNNSVDDKKGHVSVGNQVEYTTDRFGTVDKAYKGGENTFVTVTPAPDLKVSSATFSMWLRNQPFAGGTQFIFTYLDPDMDWNAGYGLWQEGSMRGDTLRYKAFTRHLSSDIYGWLDTDGGELRKVLFPSSKWFQLVISYDATSSIRKTYYNGTKVASDTLKDQNVGLGAITVPTTAKDFFIGKNPNIGQDWIGNYKGDLDDFRIYDKALTDGQVKALYDGELEAESE